MIDILIDCKKDIKAAIEEKGVAVSGGLSTYADKIRNISSINNINFLSGQNVKFGFSECEKLPVLDTSNYTDMSYMFYECGKITELKGINSHNVISMSNMCVNALKLSSVEELDGSNLTDIEDIFDYCHLLKDFGGIKNLGAQPELKINYASFGTNYLLTHNSMLNIINNLYDRASAGYSIITLQFYPGKIDLLSDDEIAIATNKGWIIS